jgi:hypothetical protein
MSAISGGGGAALEKRGEHPSSHADDIPEAGPAKKARPFLFKRTAKENENEPI